jgi:hypothetical protein
MYQNTDKTSLWQGTFKCYDKEIKIERIKDENYKITYENKSYIGFAYIVNNGKIIKAENDNLSMIATNFIYDKVCGFKLIYSQNQFYLV